MAHEPFIRDYVRQLLAQAWRDAPHFKFAVLFEVVLLAVTWMLGAWVWKGGEASWKRLASVGLTAVLIFAGHIVLAAARLHKDALANARKLEAQLETCQAALVQQLQPDAVPYEPLGRREVIVCLVEVSGINPFLVGPLDNDLNQVLLDLETALTEARLTTLESVRKDSALQTAVVPSAQRILIKPIGGRAMLVWEYPLDDRVRRRVETELALWIVDFLGHLQHNFYAKMKDLGLRRAVRNDPLTGLRLSIALSRGTAWKRVSDFGSSLIDYAGLPVTEATLLLQKALPSGGFVASLHIAPYLFMERLCANQGSRIDQLELVDTKNVISYWVLGGREEIPKRRAKGDLLTDLPKAYEWLRDPYPSMPGSVPLDVDDALFVFKLRETWEARFASDLAQRVHDRRVLSTKLEVIERTVSEMDTMLPAGGPVAILPGWKDSGLTFHSKIAELSDVDQSDERSMFTTAVYERTWPVYRYATSDPKKVVDEHRKIIEAIKAGAPDTAGALVESHLQDHYGRAKDALLRTDGL